MWNNFERPMTSVKDQVSLIILLYVIAEKNFVSYPN